jgi:GT2 family glycosyltransferase
MAQLAVVILTLGDRPGPLLDALRSVTSQREVEVEVAVVWNGTSLDSDRADDATWSDGDIDGAVRHVRLPENVGIPAGRNAGARATTAPLLLFLDDDAEVVEESTLASAVALFARPDLGAVSLRIVDEWGETSQRHVPRWGKRTVDRSGEVTSFLGGATIVRRAAFDEAGGYEGRFFYSLEETDLAWRLVDRGWSIWYAADLRVRHPRTTPARHPGAARRTARNRVWLVHRLLPLPLALSYLVTWFAISAVRAPRGVGSVAAGYWEGWRTRIGPRRPVGWRTVARLSRTGRPPVV